MVAAGGASRSPAPERLSTTEETWLKYCYQQPHHIDVTITFECHDLYIDDESQSIDPA
jgi:hypothetical protein